MQIQQLLNKSNLGKIFNKNNEENETYDMESNKYVYDYVTN